MQSTSMPGEIPGLFHLVQPCKDREEYRSEGHRLSWQNKVSACSGIARSDRLFNGELPPSL